MTPVTELLIYEAARSQLVDEIIIPPLKRGEIVICDRFTDSTIAYQGYGRSIPLTLISSANKWATDSTGPDLTFFLDIPWEESLRRRASAEQVADRMENQKETFFAKVREGYMVIAREESERFKSLDGTLPVAELEQNVLDIVLDTINAE